MIIPGWVLAAFGVSDVSVVTSEHFDDVTYMFQRERSMVCVTVGERGDEFGVSGGKSWIFHVTVTQEPGATK